GYYLDNGASVCDRCSSECEKTNFSVEEVLAACGIEKRILPEHLYDDPATMYDRWGNIVLEDGRRLRGELFHDESVQKILVNKLPLFTKYVKYPRTQHLPWSESVNKDDRKLESTEHFEGKRVVVTVKVDGENSTFYNDFYHARSLDNKRHPSRDWIKQFHARICGDIPEGWRICGENLFAKHSIKYTNLKSYFYGFSVWDEYNKCLSWDDTLEWFSMLGITPVEVIYDDIYNKDKIKSLWKPEDWETREGYVLRIADSFNYKDFKTSVGKFVRKNHVQTVQHWMFGQPMEKNLLGQMS
ncbi:MAG TPA: RNA ligase family protein, partial [Leptospiraceae bacterium]|nr:RNA ligase family protein [Leptospiraceae bacterium]